MAKNIAKGIMSNRVSSSEFYGSLTFGNHYKVLGSLMAVWMVPYGAFGVSFQGDIYRRSLRFGLGVKHFHKNRSY